MSSIFIKIGKYCIIITLNKLKHELKELSKRPGNKKMSDLWPWQFSVFNQLLPSAGGELPENQIFVYGKGKEQGYFAEVIQILHW